MPFPDTPGVNAPAVFKHDGDDILNGWLLAGFDIAGLRGGGFFGDGRSAFFFRQVAGGGQHGKLVPRFGCRTHASGLLRHTRHCALLNAVTTSLRAIAPRTHFPRSNTGRHGAFFVVNQFQPVLFGRALFIRAQHFAGAEVMANSAGHTALGPFGPFTDLAAIWSTHSYFEPQHNIGESDEKPDTGNEEADKTGGILPTYQINPPI
jgi:hypothetical protein